MYHDYLIKNLFHAVVTFFFFYFNMTINEFKLIVPLPHAMYLGNSNECVLMFCFSASICD